MLEDKDRENRALRLELFNTRADHWATLSRFVGPRPHPSPFGPQAPQDRLFPDDHVPLPGFGGDFYEDYYGAV